MTIQNDGRHGGRGKEKIAFIVSHAAGGVMEVMVSLAEGLGRRGHATRLMALYPQYGERGGLTIGDWAYFAQAKPRSPLAGLRLLIGMARWLRTERPDVAITAMQTTNVVLPVMARLFSPQTRVIVTHHSPSDMNHPLLNWADARTGAMPNVSAIISVSSPVRESLSGRSPVYRAKSHVITNALPPALEREIDRLRGERSGKAPGRVATAVGRLSAQKNLDILIRAASHVPDLEVRLIGDGEARASLETLAAALNVTGRVIFLGHRDRTEAMQLLAQSDLFIQMSRYEGHSLALIEAARLGLPLIVSDIPSQREAVTAPDGSLGCPVLDPDDEQALAAAIRALIDDPARMATASAASLATAARCNFSDMVEAYRQRLADDTEAER